MTQALQDDLHTLSQVKEGERVIFQHGGFQIKPKYSFWLFDWFLGNARLSSVFEGIRERLCVEGLDSRGLGADRLVEDLSSLRAQIQRMKRNFDAKHGFVYKLFFDQDVDVNYRQLMRQVDYLMARLAKQELDELQAHVGREAQRLRALLGGRFHDRRSELDQRIRALAGEITKRMQASQAIDDFVSWQNDPGVQEVRLLWDGMWKKLDHALDKGQELSRLLSEETSSQFDSIEPLSVNHHNEIISKLVTWEGVVKGERRNILNAMQSWNQARNQLLARFQDRYEQIEDQKMRASYQAEISRLKELFVERERTYLSFLEEAQRGLGTIVDQLQDGIRRLGRVLTTDEYLDTRVAA